ncbi:hypothetical protein ANTRET_LOCUS10394 [Anthophora retusa]
MLSSCFTGTWRWSNVVGRSPVKIKLRFSAASCVHHCTGIILGGGAIAKCRRNAPPAVQSVALPAVSVVGASLREWYFSLREARNIDLHAASCISQPTNSRSFVVLRVRLETSKFRGVRVAELSGETE